MPRNVFLSGVGLAAVAIALAFTDWALSLQPGVTEANVRRVQPGMRFAEVVAVLGPPARGSSELAAGRVQTIAWGGEMGDAVITFGREGEVLDVLFIPEPNRHPPGPLARLLAWLGL